MDKVILYHGSTLRVDRPLCNVGREDLDFGKGFYLTRLKEQAVNWANRMRLIRAADLAYINVYKLNMEQVLANEYRLFNMSSYNQEWLDFIVQSRNGKKPWLPYDIIEGGVADDKVIDTVEEYISGNITVEQALGQLIHKHPNNQMCILNQEIIDNHLTYIESIPI